MVSSTFLCESLPLVRSTHSFSYVPHLTLPFPRQIGSWRVWQSTWATTSWRRAPTQRVWPNPSQSSDWNSNRKEPPESDYKLTAPCWKISYTIEAKRRSWAWNCSSANCEKRTWKSPLSKRKTNYYAPDSKLLALAMKKKWKYAIASNIRFDSANYLPWAGSLLGFSLLGCCLGYFVAMEQAWRVSSTAGWIDARHGGLGGCPPQANGRL